MPDLASDVQEINQLHEAASEKAERIGELLTFYKEKAGHGNWLTWLEANCPAIKTQRASEYMRAYKAAKFPKSGNMEKRRPIKPAACLKANLGRATAALEKAIEVARDAGCDDVAVRSLNDAARLVAEVEAIHA